MTKRAHWSPHKLVAGLVALPGKSGVPVRVGVFAQRHCVNSVRLVAALKALGLLSPVTPNAKSGKEAGIDPTISRPLEVDKQVLTCYKVGSTSYYGGTDESFRFNTRGNA
jgi:hypothetical protein